MVQESDFLLGPWKVRPRLNRVQRGDDIGTLQPRLMELLICLSRHPGEVVSKERLLETVWPDTHVGEGVLTTAVYELRKILEDDSRQPSLIETVPKRGYRLIAPVVQTRLQSRPPRSSRLLPGRIAWSVGLLVPLVVAAGWWISENAPADETEFREPLWVLIADFENRTGEELLDGTLEFELEQQLAHSRWVNVAPRDRINDVLRLMRRPTTSVVDADLGREICLRDGGIGALLSGKIEKAGAGYRLSLRIIDPGQGAVVTSVTMQATDQDELLETFSRAGLWARESLGEWMTVPPSQDRLEEVTTSSLRALHLYSQAMSLSRAEPRTESRREPKWRTVETLLRDAVREDPDFASAHLLLAWSMHNRRRPSEEILAHAERAVALASTVSRWERHFIMASYYRFLGESEKEFAEYEALLAIRPNHYWGINNLALWHLRNHSRCDKVDESRCTSYVVRWAELRPKAYSANWRAAMMLAIGQGDLEVSAPFVKRASRLLETEFERGANTAWIDLFPFHRAWVDNDLDTALQALEPAVSRLASARGPQRLFYPWILGGHYLTLGRLEQARQTFEWMDEPPRGWPLRHVYLAMTAYLAEQPDLVRRHLEVYSRDPNYAEATGEILLIRAGYWKQAERLLPRLRAEGVVCEAHLKAIKGEIALAKGQPETGIELLKEAFALLPVGIPEYFLAAESLAGALQVNRQGWSAIAVLERASLEKRRAYWASGFLWLRIRFQLAQIYRQMGELERASRIETELRQLLKYADPSHPLVIALTEP